ncbi:PREDICTED: uncharacterized protein LOC104826572 [Tarenaya hassleriana]|uniref:uncharacterized protein LOC104826572 n=1 Tax=Tarenaya hassleriana TaxID=28532 RepID=UPI00053C662B|nr:PREDICTED: uncharacterized protein LOC104826572 [Tarenaya hassleriana]
MPLYDCMLLFKPVIRKESLMDLVARVGRHVYSRNGVLTEIRSFGKVELGYGIKMLDGRHYQGQLMQMTMMATPNINKELQYLNKEDRLLRWLLVKHRNVKIGKDYMSDVHDVKTELGKFYGESSEDEEDESDDFEYDELENEEWMKNV